MLYCLTWKFKTWFPKPMKKILMNDWCLSWCQYELHTRKMLQTVEQYARNIFVRLLLISSFLKQSKKALPFRSVSWVNCWSHLSRFLSEPKIQCILSWIQPFHLCTMRKAWITVCDYSMFLVGVKIICVTARTWLGLSRGMVNGCLVWKDFEDDWGQILSLFTLMSLLLCLKPRSFLSSLRQWWERKKYGWSWSANKKIGERTGGKSEICFLFH